MASASAFLQAACYEHQFIRSKDTSLIVERPERLRAVTVGLASALSRLEESRSSTKVEDDSDLATAFERINLGPTHPQVLRVVHSSATAALLNHPAIKFVHGDIEADKYLEKLLSWARDSRTKIANGESEIPDGLSQGDLYCELSPITYPCHKFESMSVCPSSINAIQGALGTICQAVDSVLNPEDPSRAFVAIRPPGHHCGEDTPSGFCFVNNVAVAAAHAHLQHNIKRIVIFDIDLHHGNGTQSIVWQINEETYRQTLESEGGAPPTKIGPKVYYGSLHDILSYPCEDGKLELVQAASKYTSEDHFWNDLYPNRYRRIMHKAKDFLDTTGGPGEDVMIFISCGFDACEHEYTSMSRHDRKVPTSFYHRFTQDVRKFSDQYTRGRLISVLEGGYSDRALISGTLAHLCGLVGDVVKVDDNWWSPENLDEIEKATKKKRGGRPSLSTPSTPWVANLLEHFAALEAEIPQLTRNSRPSVPVATSTRQLRERKTQPVAQANSKSQSPQGKTKDTAVSESPPAHADSSDESSLSSLDSTPEDGPPVKKGPRVILRLGPKP
ncbi:hypothetical protein ONZ45_g7525 [Pleurotus djamor]|nr:hypothetical protein ONZ45_g7525 [Pleurotus djamor]